MAEKRDIISCLLKIIQYVQGYFNTTIDTILPFTEGLLFEIFMVLEPGLLSKISVDIHVS